MSYNNDHLPREAEMNPEDFGPKQVRNYILAAYDNIFNPGEESCLIRSQRMLRPDITIEEDGTMTILITGSKVRLRKMDNGMWHYVLNDDVTQIRVIDGKRVFMLIEYVLQCVLSAEMDLFLLHTYDCAA